MRVDGLQSSAGRAGAENSLVPRRAAEGKPALGVWLLHRFLSHTETAQKATALCLGEIAIVRLVTLNKSLSLPETDEQMWREAEKSFVAS